METRATWVRMIVAVQFGLPAALYALRLMTGEIVWYGGGWQMFSG